MKIKSLHIEQNNEKQHGLISLSMLVFLLLLVLMSSLKLQAQDIHFSQLERSPLNLNPAETGNFKAKHRVIANYRNQWASVTVPYKTFSASYEHRRNTPFKLPGNLGLGLLFNSDVAGDGNFGTAQIKGSAAYRYADLLDSNLSISLGFNVGYNQQSVDFQKLYFDNQYNGNVFNPLEQTNEKYSGESLNYFDFALGLKVSYLINDQVPLFLGLDFNHLNRPSQSFYKEQLSQLDGKFNLYTSSVISMSKYWSFMPSVFYFNQGQYNELFYGALLKRELNDINFRSVNFGLTNRSGDAVILRFGMEYQNFDIAFSYDLNYSSLRIASRGIGAFELSVIYLLHESVKYQRNFNRQCPVFM